MQPRTRRILAVTAVLGLGAAAAFAATNEWCGGHRWEQRRPAMLAAAQGWLLESAPGQTNPQALADKLKLSAEQKPLWERYAATLAVPSGTAASGRIDPGGSATSAPERLEHALADTQQRQARATERLQAMKALYAQLTPEQRQRFDDAQRRHHHGPRHEHGEGR